MFKTKVAFLVCFLSILSICWAEVAKSQPTSSTTSGKLFNTTKSQIIETLFSFVKI